VLELFGVIKQQLCLHKYDAQTLITILIKVSSNDLYIVEALFIDQYIPKWILKEEKQRVKKIIGSCINWPSFGGLFWVIIVKNQKSNIK